MSLHRFTVSLSLVTIGFQPVVAQASNTIPNRWFSMSGGLGPAGGGGYATVAERKASVSFAFPAYGHRLDASVLGAWSGSTVFCNVNGDSSCPGAPELVGGAISLLSPLGLAPGAGVPLLSLGVGAYRLSDGAAAKGVGSGIYPAVLVGLEKAFPTTDGFAITVAAHAVLSPDVHGRRFLYLPLSFGFRMW
jgi:hypothetical protein